jgi:hypothetical protein
MSAYIIDEGYFIPVIHIVQLASKIILCLWKQKNEELDIAMRATGQEQELIDRLKE